MLWGLQVLLVPMSFTGAFCQVHGLPGWLWACTTTAGLLSKSLAASMLPVNCYDLGCSRVLVGAPGYSQLCQLHPPDHPGEAKCQGQCVMDAAAPRSAAVWAGQPC